MNAEKIIRHAGIRRQRRRQQSGGATFPMFLALILVIIAIGHGTVLISTSGVMRELVEAARHRAEMCATSACIRTEKTLARDLPPVIREALERATVDPRFAHVTYPLLMGAHFEPLHFDYDYADLLGADNTATADVTIYLAAYPISKSPSGLASNREGITLDTYDFWCKIKSTGRSGRYGHCDAVSMPMLKIGVISGPTTSPMIVKLAALPNPASVTGAKTSLSSLANDTMQVEEYDYNGTWPPQSSAPVPDGAWSGDPEVVSGPTLYGYPGGDGLYVYELRGVPSGTSGTGPETTVLAFDDWRFQMDTYNRGTDVATFSQGPNLPQIERKGSPNYAIAVVRAPHAGQMTTLPVGYGTLQLPNGSVFTLPSIADSWVAPSTPLFAAGGVGPFMVTGEPRSPLERLPNDGYGRMVDGAPSPTGNPPAATGPQLERNAQEIRVGGFAEDLAADPSLFPSFTRDSTATGPVQIPLLIVLRKRSELSMSWPGGPTSASVITAAHASYAPEDAPELGDPPPPDPTCTDCDPPTRTLVIAGCLLVPGDVMFVPDDVGGQPKP